METYWILFKHAIPMIRLPHVVRDAILIVRKLGLRYLWVDALCIIQDDLEDVRSEISAMAATFRNSLLTIAVVDTPTDSTGIFQARQGALSSRERPAGVLDTRGWVLQEQLLSVRVLSYTEEQLFWDCNCCQASEAYPRGLSGLKDTGFRHINRRFRRLITGPTSAFATSWEREKGGYWLWRNILEHYTTRDVSFPSDRLFAIEAVASVFGTFLQDEMVYGIWMKELARHLLWWSLTELDGRFPSELGPSKDTRPLGFHAPSWSWASVNWPISHGVVKDYIMNTPEPGFRTLDSNMIKLNKISGGYLPGDPHGSVHGQLVLTGSVTRVYLRPEWLGNYLFLTPGTIWLILLLRAEG
jgi:hypothetical protein